MVRLGVLVCISCSICGCSPQRGPAGASVSFDPWVIRTDFSDEELWNQVCNQIAAPQAANGGEFFAYVQFVSNERYSEKTAREIVAMLPGDYRDKFCFIVDRICLLQEEHPVLVVGFYPHDAAAFNRPPRQTPDDEVVTFRALPSELQGIQNNLSIANMDFEDFSAAVEADGIFRGFSRK